MKILRFFLKSKFIQFRDVFRHVLFLFKMRPGLQPGFSETSQDFRRGAKQMFILKPRITMLKVHQNYVG